MIRFRSLRSRIVSIFLIVILLVQVLELSVISSAIVRNARAAVDKELIRGELNFKRLINQNTEHLTDNLRVLAKDTGFLAAVADPSDDTETRETIVSALSNSANRIGATHAMLFALDGRLRGATVDPEQSRDLIEAATRMLETADSRNGAVDLALHDGLPYQAVVVPVNAPRLIGWLAMMVPVNQRLTSEMRDLTSLDVSIIAKASDRPWYAGPATLAPEQATALAVSLRGKQTAGPTTETVDLLGSEYRVRLLPLVSHGPQAAMVVLQRSITEATEPYLHLQYTLIALTALGVVLAMVISTLTVRRVTEPLQSLTEMANRLGQGDYDAHIEFRRDDEVGALSHAFGAMRDGIAKRESEIRHLAYFDALTDLPNRTRFAMEIESRISGSKPDQPLQMGILMLDLDRFKTVNDVLGHAVGDQLLKQIAIRLRATLSQEILLARPGGDEFYALVMGGAVEARNCAQLILRAMEQPISVEDQTVDVGCSVGIACYPEHGGQAAALLGYAELAMYAAKSAREGVVMYTPSLDRSTLHSLTLLSDMRRAIELNEFRLYVQPKLDLRSGSVVGMEALVRWQHPERGTVFPDQFIPFAEQTGFIRALTRWVIEQAATLSAGFQARGHDLKISVNLSTRDLLDPDLPQRFLSVVNGAGVRPTAFCLEITESAIMDDPERALQTLEHLHAMGFDLSIDDFGTGYSSLAYLKRLPVDELKIDKSFVLNIEHEHDDVKLVKSTIDLGHNMGLRVVAEGIENLAVWNLLCQMGCDQGQGYFMSRPIPASQVVDWMQQWQPPHGPRERDVESV